ncbi:MAG TPA: glycosyltransferase family 39 protein [Candidatus Acidoferrales bacterium]|nr:glycosyltransferase family 39 protein [Candidatus Acidoferrales bacterium]
MADTNGSTTGTPPAGSGRRSYLYLAVLLVASAVYLGCIISPPSLMDDVDAVQAQIARNMLTSGDWVTARLDGVPYLEKAPLVYWAIAASYKVFGVHDWSARIPIALSAIALALLTAAFATWAFGRRAGLYAGLCIATCIGLFLFTRILIPDVMLTCTIALAMWAFLRALDETEPHARLWAAILAASFGVGLLLKSLISVLFPAGAALVYLAVTRQLFVVKTWKRLHLLSGALIALAIAAPWHILGTLRNPPYFSFTFHSGPGQYHGFLWFFFINEQVLRFLNLRYPRDYNTVPRFCFWTLHLVWLFPWSVYFPAVAKLSFRPIDRAAKTRLLALCWVGFVLVFFSFSTTQEYYSMPIYPALALLLGSAIATGGVWVNRGTRFLAVLAGLAATACFVLIFLVRHVPTPGDISSALSQHPSAYTLALGHMLDLTLDSFAYLRVPLAIAGVAFLIGALGTIRWSGWRAAAAISLMMVLFLQAARLAMVTFDPFLSSRPLAEVIRKSPPGKLIMGDQYYTYSSIFFYTGQNALLLNGRYFNLEYGSYAPGAANVFINDPELKELWDDPSRYYLVADRAQMDHLKSLLGFQSDGVIAASGGKFLLSNHPLSYSLVPRASPRAYTR